MNRRHFFKLAATAAAMIGINIKAKEPETMPSGSPFADIFRQTDLTVGLFESEINEESNGREVSGNWYKRMSIEFESSKTSFVNKNNIDFPAFNEDTLIVKGIGIFDKKGNMLFFKNLKQKTNQIDTFLFQLDKEIHLTKDAVLSFRKHSIEITLN